MNDFQKKIFFLVLENANKEDEEKTSTEENKASTLKKSKKEYKELKFEKINYNKEYMVIANFNSKF